MGYPRMTTLRITALAVELGKFLRELISRSDSPFAATLFAVHPHSFRSLEGSVSGTILPRVRPAFPVIRRNEGAHFGNDGMSVGFETIFAYLKGLNFRALNLSHW